MEKLPKRQPPQQPVNLSARQRRALEAICDTICPPPNGVPSATELGVPDALLDAIALNPRESERKQLAQLLGPVGHARCSPPSAGAG